MSLSVLELVMADDLRLVEEMVVLFLGLTLANIVMMSSWRDDVEPPNLLLLDVEILEYLVTAEFIKSW